MKMLICVLAFLFTTCNNSEESENDAYKTIERNIDESCEMYLMYYFEGNYIYRVGTIDSCGKLPRDRYISTYESILRNNFDKIKIKKGKIIFETGFDFGEDSVFRKKLLDITKKKFKSPCSVVYQESSRNELTIIVE